MRTITSVQIRLLAMVAILLLASPAVRNPLATPPIARAQEPVALYRSEVFDYFFFYDAAIWEIEEQASESGFEAVRFFDGEVFVDYRAFDAPGMTARDCLDQVLDGLANDPSVLEVEPLIPDYQNFDYGIFASMKLVLTIDGDQGRFKLATDEQCEELDPGQTLLYRSINVPAEAYNEGRRFDRPWIAGYRPSDEFPAKEGPNADHYAGTPVSVLNAGGAVLGTFTAGVFCAPSEVDVVVRGLASTAGFTVDPSAFTFTYYTGETVAPASASWLYPDVPPTSSLDLRDGDVGLLRLETQGTPDAYDLYYSPADEESVDLGGSIRACGAGGGLPALIDLE
jgi:hypothetical protein